ncbi:TPM domain-containing protein [Tenacibaculum sp. SDUM215027]|uniref:TPM domain-containing protein n=1 Tax=Tenacibaculum sp. SDUM215027 TaxID=3422596 RepID=UPI003D3214E4
MKKYLLKCLLLFVVFQVYSFQGVVEEEKVSIVLLENETKEEQEEIKLTYPDSFIPPKYTQKEVYTVKDVPNPKKNGANGFVSDPNNYINEIEEKQLNLKLWEIEQNTTAQVVVVILKSIGKEVPKNFAVKLFEEWEIGDKETDNGLLILTVIDQRRTEFEVGYGLEPTLTDIVCHRIGTDEIVPYFKEGEFGKGLLSAVSRVREIINKPDVIDEIFGQDINYYEETKTSKSPFIIYLLFYGTFSLFVGGWFVIKARSIDTAKEDLYDKYQDMSDLGLGCLLFLFPLPLYFINKYVKAKLKLYRFSPRFSKKNGKQLYLKNEWSENDFLEKAQILEEKIQSKEYDVWVTEDESDILILEYEGSSRKYSNCKKCGYKTYGRISTKVLDRATYQSSGKKQENYLCKNCNYRESKTIIIPRLERSSSSSSSSGGSSWSSSSSSSSSFGGGSSGGGGAGVSW